MLPAGVSDLRSAFHQHTSSVGNDDSASHRLLWFYAVECGLKSVYLARNSFRTTDQMPQQFVSHDLGTLVKELRLPASTVGQIPSFHLRKDSVTSHPLKQAHQAWRYGITIKPDDERVLKRWLDKVHDWVKGEV